MKPLHLPLLLSPLLLAACSSLEGTPLDPDATMRVTEQSPTEISYEYMPQWPSLLQKTADLAEQHCQANGKRKAVEFHRWGGGPLTSYVTYRCIVRL